MKKKYVTLSIPLLMVLMPLFSAAQPPHAKAWGKRGGPAYHRHPQPVRTKVFYEYYPSMNVYFNPVLQRYWYPRNGVWIQANVLPQGFILSNKRRQKVWCYDNESVWVNQRYYADMPIIVAPPPRTGVSVNINARF
jgi:hypothetical protein